MLNFTGAFLERHRTLPVVHDLFLNMPTHVIAAHSTVVESSSLSNVTGFFGVVEDSRATLFSIRFISLSYPHQSMEFKMHSLILV